MNVFDGDPNRLEWKSKGENTVLGIFSPGTGFIKESAISGFGPPSDKEFEALMNQAKDQSRDQSSPFFLIMRRVRNKKDSTRPIPFAEYVDGDLVAFCRPPWRRGEGIL